MFLIKAKCHIFCAFIKLLYKLIYGSRLRFGKGVTWRKGFSLMIDKKAAVSIGNGCFFNNYCSVNSNESVTIGNNCIFGENVKIYDHNHRFSQRDKPIKDQGFSNKPVVIGDNCWIGSNVTILKGVTVGEGCVIGAGAVISRDIPSHMLVRTGADVQLEEIRGKSI